MKNLSKCMALLIVFYLMGTNTYAASSLEDLFSNLLKSNEAVKQEKIIDPQVVINAQLEPYISSILTNDNSCSIPLDDQDLIQMQHDQFLINSFLNLYKIDANSKAVSGSNLYMSVLIQKIRGPLELLNNEDLSYLSKLNQSTLSVANFEATSQSILKLDKVITAHQSLYLNADGKTGYTTGGFLALAIEEYKICMKTPSLCSTDNSLWKKWFQVNGFGLYNPQITEDMTTIGANTSKENFDINVPVLNGYSSNILTKNLFEILNTYGGVGFEKKYFDYLSGQTLKDEKTTSNVINAPGKIVGGLLLQLVAQRLVPYYKYQKCRLLEQNSKNAELAMTYTKLSANSSDPKSLNNHQVIIQCSSSQNCSPGYTQVTSGNTILAIKNLGTEEGPTVTSCPTNQIKNSSGTCELASCKSGLVEWKGVGSVCKGFISSQLNIGTGLSFPSVEAIYNSSGVSGHAKGTCLIVNNKAEFVFSEQTCLNSASKDQLNGKITIEKPAITNITSSVDSGLSLAVKNGLHCDSNQKDLYNGADLVATCPRGPNGGITCQASGSSPAACATKGFVFINGKEFKWEGNTSGYCYSSSACESGFDCNNHSCTKRKALETNENGVKYLQEWDKKTNAWSITKVASGCSTDYVSEGSTCINKKQCGTLDHGVYYQYYKNSAWGSCSSENIVCDSGYERDGEYKRCTAAGTKNCSANTSNVAMSSPNYDLVKRFGGVFIENGKQKTLYGDLPTTSNWQNVSKVTFTCKNGYLDGKVVRLELGAWCAEQNGRCDCPTYGWTGFSRSGVQDGYDCEVGVKHQALPANLKHGEGKSVPASAGYSGEIKLYCFGGKIQTSMNYSGPKECKKVSSSITSAPPSPAPIPAPNPVVTPVPAPAINKTPVCGGLTHLDKASNQCMSCPSSSQTWNGTACIEATKVVVTPPKPAPAPAPIPSPAITKTPVCGGLTHLDKASNQCVSCPSSSQTWNGMACIEGTTAIAAPPKPACSSASTYVSFGGNYTGSCSEFWASGGCADSGKDSCGVTYQSFKESCTDLGGGTYKYMCGRKN